MNKEKKEASEQEIKAEFNQIAYQNEYNRSNYDRIGIMVKKGQKEEIKKAAAKEGISLNELINRAIVDYIGKVKPYEGNR